MKTKLFCLVYISLCMSFIFLSTSQDAKAEVTDLGEFCFSLDITRTSLATNKLRLHVSSLNGQSFKNFKLNGDYRLSDRTLLAPVHGTAVLEGNDVVATLTGTLISGQTPPTGSIIYLHIMLNRSQLAGTGNQLSVEIDGPKTGTDEITVRHLISAEFNVDKTPCESIFD